MLGRRPQARYGSDDRAHPTKSGDELVDRSRLYRQGEGRSLSRSSHTLRGSPHDNIHDGVPGSIDATKHELGTAACVARIERADLHLASILARLGEAAGGSSQSRDRVMPAVALHGASETPVARREPNLDEVVIQPDDLNRDTCVQMRSRTTQRL